MIYCIYLMRWERSLAATQLFGVESDGACLGLYMSS